MADHWQTLVLELLLLVVWVGLGGCVPSTGSRRGIGWLRGFWVGVVLLVFIGALVWSKIAPGALSLGFTELPNFWWHLIGAALLACLALFCGWLQGVLGWMPADVPIYPESATADDTHGHEHPVGALHGHDQFHEDEPQADGHGHH